MPRGWSRQLVCRSVASSTSRRPLSTYTKSDQPKKDLLLGLGRPINDIDSETFKTAVVKGSYQRLRFPNALQDWIGRPSTLRERVMMGMMERIMGKQGWERKIFDQGICAKWKREGVSEMFSERMFDYVS